MVFPWLAGMVGFICPCANSAHRRIIWSGMIASLVAQTIVALWWLFHPAHYTFHVVEEIRLFNYVIATDFVLSPTSVFLSYLVVWISFCAHIYSFSYQTQTRQKAYYLLCGAFTSAMIGFILCDNALLLIGCWEWAGSISYLLISFHHRDKEAVRGGAQAFIINKIGSLGLWLFVILMGLHFRSFSFSVWEQTLSLPAKVGATQLWQASCWALSLSLLRVLFMYGCHLP